MEPDDRAAPQGGPPLGTGGEEARATPGELLRALVPGAARPGTLLLALGAAAVGLLLVGLAVGLVLDTRGRLLLGAGGLLAWGHGAVWLTTGTLQRLDSGLADLAGAQWAVFFVVWWAPIAVVWGLARHL